MFTESNNIYKKGTAVQESIGMVHGISLFNINGLGIPFSNKWKRVAVNVSVSYTHLTLPTNREV